MEDKVEEYLKIIYSENDLSDEKEKVNIDRDKKFIAENIEEINNKFEQFKQIQTKEEVKIDEVSKDNDSNVDNENKEKNDILEENHTNLDGEDAKNNVTNDDTKENEIDEKKEEFNDKNLLNNIIKDIKINKYFFLLHPEYDELKEDEKYYVLDDKIVIRDCLDAIDAYYQDCKTIGSGAQEMEWTDQMIIEMALELFNKQEKIFTPSDIEQFSSKVKYAEFKQAITNIKEIANEDKEENNEEEE